MLKKPTCRFSFDIDRELHTQLKILAAEDHTTIANMLRKRIKKMVKEQLKISKPGPVPVQKNKVGQIAEPVIATVSGILYGIFNLFRA
jgi:hypothetical protein